MEEEQRTGLIDHSQELMELNSGDHEEPKLPHKDYESLDYDVCYNKPFSKMLASRDKKSLWGQEIVRWLVTGAIGILTGLVAVFIDYFVTLLTKWKFETVNKSLLECTPNGCLAVTLLILMAVNGVFCLVAAILCAIEPLAAGSGIPEIKCYLNGVKVAKWSGDLFNEGLYDIHVKLKCVPLLEWAAPQEMYRLKASDIMESRLSYIYPHTRVHSIVRILTAHNAFPVVTVYKDTKKEVQENYHESDIDTSNERFARTTTFSNLTSEQKLRWHLPSGEESTS